MPRSSAPGPLSPSSSRFLTFLLLSSSALGLPEPGKWTLKLNSSQEYNGIAKNVYANTKIFIKIRCSGQGQNVNIGWLLRETQVRVLKSSV